MCSNGFFFIPAYMFGCLFSVVRFIVASVTSASRCTVGCCFGLLRLLLYLLVVASVAAIRLIVASFPVPAVRLVVVYVDSVSAVRFLIGNFRSRLYGWLLLPLLRLLRYGWLLLLYGWLLLRSLLYG
jgi:hypothetical protein